MSTPINTLPAETTISLRPLNTFPEPTQDQAFRRKAYIDAWLAQDNPVFTDKYVKPIIARVALAIGDRAPPSVISLYRWIRLYQRSNRDIASLLPAYHKRGPKKRHLDDELKAICDQIINDYYLTKKRLSIKSVHSYLAIAVNRANADRHESRKFKLPSYDTLRRIINDIGKFDADLARYGREYVSKKYRHSYMAEMAQYLLERVEADHTPLNVFVLDDTCLTVLGRPNITWMIDVMSRMIIGFYISFSPPSINAVLECLKHAITSKEYVKELYPDIHNEWPCHGVPHTLVVDNGKEFHAQDMVRATKELEMSYQFCAPRTPWQKPFVERSFRTLSEQFAHPLPGNSFATYLERYGYDPLKETVMTFSELVHAIHIWIIDIYHQTFHRGLNSTPHAVWRKYEEISELRCTDATALTLTLSQECIRVLGHIGIEIHGLRYNSPELLLIRKQFGDRLKVQVRYNIQDLEYIFVLHPSTKEPIKVPCLLYKYVKNLTLFQHKKIQAHLRKEGRSDSDPVALNKARELMDETVGALVRNKKLKQRKKGARLMGLNSAKLISDFDSALCLSKEVSIEEWAPPVDAELPPMQLKIVEHQNNNTKGEKK